MIEKEFKYYLENQNDLVKKYNGRFLVIVDQKVVGDYDDSEKAYIDSKEKYELGMFLIQKCSPGEDAYTQHFYTPRVVFA